MATRKEVKNRISSVKNVQKITRAMEMVAAARLRRAEQRIDALRPYARELRKMTRQVAEAAGVEARNLPVLQEHEEEKTVGDPAGHRRPRAGGFLQLADHPRRRASSSASSRARGQGGRVLGRRPPRRLDDAVPRRGAARRVRRLHRPPGLRQRAGDRRRPGRLVRRQGAEPRRPDLQPLRVAADPVRAPADAAAGPAGRGLRRGSGGADAETRPRSSTPSSPRPTARRSGTTSPSPRSCWRS